MAQVTPSHAAGATDYRMTQVPNGTHQVLDEIVVKLTDTASDDSHDSDGDLHAGDATDLDEPDHSPARVHSCDLHASFDPLDGLALDRARFGTSPVDRQSRTGEDSPREATPTTSHPQTSPPVRAEQVIMPSTSEQSLKRALSPRLASDDGSAPKRMRHPSILISNENEITPTTSKGASTAASTAICIKVCDYTRLTNSRPCGGECTGSSVHSDSDNHVCAGLCSASPHQKRQVKPTIIDLTSEGEDEQTGSSLSGGGKTSLHAYSEDAARADRRVAGLEANEDDPLQCLGRARDQALGVGAALESYMASEVEKHEKRSEECARLLATNACLVFSLAHIEKELQSVTRRQEQNKAEKENLERLLVEAQEKEKARDAEEKQLAEELRAEREAHGQTKRASRAVQSGLERRLKNRGRVAEVYRKQLAEKREALKKSEKCMRDLEGQVKENTSIIREACHKLLTFA